MVYVCITISTAYSDYDGVGSFDCRQVLVLVAASSVGVNALIIMIKY